MKSVLQGMLPSELSCVPKLSLAQKINHLKYKHIPNTTVHFVLCEAIFTHRRAIVNSKLYNCIS